MDICELINSVAEGRFADATVAARATELAEVVPEHLRESVGTSLLVQGLIAADVGQHAMANALGLTGVALLTPVDAGAR